MCANADGSWRRRWVLSLVTFCLCGAAWSTTTADDTILPRLGVTRGLCVVLGDSHRGPGGRTGAPERTADLRPVCRATKTWPPCGARSRMRASTARASTSRQGDLGASVPGRQSGRCADRDRRRRPTCREAEVLRVLRPQGKAILRRRGNWSSRCRRAWTTGAIRTTVRTTTRNRAIASREAPYLTQFLADPRYAPLPQVAVAAGGRVFKAFGHIAFKEREEPWLDTLAAFNGYNGTLLWRREIPAALMVHRNTLIATPTTVYFGDDQSCKVIDAATGETRDEIAPPADVAGGTFWKWMALEDGVLYALIGEQEQRDPVIRLRSTNHGWPWDPLSPGYNRARAHVGLRPDAAGHRPADEDRSCGGTRSRSRSTAGRCA